MSTTEEPAPAPLSQEELVAMVTKAHLDPSVSYADGKLAGTSLAAASKLPRAVAENLGAGFGQWTFFPEPVAIVAFARDYAAPSTEEELMALARAWAEDDAAGKHTVLALVGRDILLMESRRIESAGLRAFLAEHNAVRALGLRRELGLAVPSAPPPGAPVKAARAAKKAAAPKVEKPDAVIPSRMPMPAPRKPPKAAPAAPARRFVHPKFGEGVLQSQEGTGPDAKLTLTFAAGPKTVLARFVEECPDAG